MKRMAGRSSSSRAAQRTRGKSTVAANLALSLAQKHQRVLLLDADLRKPAQSLIFSASRCPGTDLWLSHHAPPGPRGAGKRPLSATRRPACPISMPRRCGAARAGAQPGFIPSSARCAARELFLILIDTPPFSFFADAEVLADAADAAILVVRQDLVPAAVVNDTIDDLNAAHAARSSSAAVSAPMATATAMAATAENTAITATAASKERRPLMEEQTTQRN